FDGSESLLAAPLRAVTAHSAICVPLVISGEDLASLVALLPGPPALVVPHRRPVGRGRNDEGPGKPDAKCGALCVRLEAGVHGFAFLRRFAFGLSQDGPKTEVEVPIAFVVTLCRRMATANRNRR